MRCQVLLFASLREITGKDTIELDLEPGAVVGDVRRRIVDSWPDAAKVPFVFAVNREYAADDHVLADGDEVALVPPISGGADEQFGFEFVHGALDPRELEQRALSDEDGALVTFTGATRRTHEGRVVRSLAYEAFEPMARQKVLSILTEAASGREIGRILVQHRLGDVPLGEASILVVVAAPHRGPAFEAAREIMDRIKREVPIFKKEFYEDDEDPRWLGELPQS